MRRSIIWMVALIMLFSGCNCINTFSADNITSAVSNNGSFSDYSIGEEVYKNVRVDTDWQKEWEYKTSNGYIVLTKYTGVSDNVIVPGMAVINGNTFKTAVEGNLFPTDVVSVVFADKVTANNCEGTFAGCRSLSSADISGLDFSQCRNTRNMFSGCTSLTYINMSNLDFSSVIETENMFYNSGISVIDTPVNVSTEIFLGDNFYSEYDAQHADAINVLPQKSAKSIRLTKKPVQLSAAVPIELVMTVNESGSLSAPDNYRIENNSDVAIFVNKIRAVPKNGFSLSESAGPNTFYIGISVNGISRVLSEQNLDMQDKLKIIPGNVLDMTISGKMGKTETDMTYPRRAFDIYYTISAESTHLHKRTARYYVTVNKNPFIRDTAGYGIYSEGDTVELTGRLQTGGTNLAWVCTSGNAVLNKENIFDQTVKFVMPANDVIISCMAVPIGHEVRFDPDNGALTGQDKKEVTYGEPYGILPVATKAGYTAVSWKNENGEIIGKDTIVVSVKDEKLIPAWIPDTNTSYTVIHKKQNSDGTYSITDTEKMTGTTETEITPEVKEYVGFSSPERQTKTIAADGNMVITYEYVRNSYTVTYVAGEHVKSVLNADHRYYFNETVTLSSNDFEFDTGYESGSISKNEIIRSFTMPADNVTMSVHGIPVKYSIEYELGNGVNNGGNPCNYSIVSDNIVIASPKADNKIFAGWKVSGFSSAGVDSVSKNVIIPTGTYGNIILTAVWEEDKLVWYGSGMDLFKLNSGSTNCSFYNHPAPEGNAYYGSSYNSAKYVLYGPFGTAGAAAASTRSSYSPGRFYEASYFDTTEQNNENKHDYAIIYWWASDGVYGYQKDDTWGAHVGDEGANSDGIRGVFYYYALRRVIE